jgi:hypothetical protein
MQQQQKAFENASTVCVAVQNTSEYLSINDQQRDFF